MSYFVDSAGVTSHPFGQGGGEKLADKYHAPLLGKLPLDANIGVCADTGENFIARYGDSIAAKIYHEIVGRF